MAGLRVILIGGASHTGKTTLARRLAAELGWTWTSTDSLARHPGRPWPMGERPVPPHVAAHYRELEPDALIDSVLAHYDGVVWPLVDALVRRAVEVPEATGLVLEGSALLPDRVVALRLPNMAALWLTAEPALLESRILAESRHAGADPAGKLLIQRFIARAQRFDRLVREAAARLRLPQLDAAAATPEAALGLLDVS